MNLPLIYFLYVFYAGAFVWFAVSLINLYHLLHNSANDKKAPFIAIIYIAGSLAIFASFFSFSSTIDWQADFNLSSPAALSQPNFDAYGN